MDFRTSLVAASAVAALTGCAGLADTRTATVASYDGVRKAPMLPVQRNVTSFTDGLRCMDDLFEQYGTHASLMVEDLNDKTQKSAAGTTEMFLAALSEMTRRSAAIRTVAFSEDTRNLTNFMTKAGTKDAFQIANIPAYSVRGSVSQFDDNLAKKTNDAGISIGSFSIGGAKSSSINMVGLDLVVLRAQDFSLVPGVKASNVAAILQEGTGLDADVTYKKLGVNFMTSLSKSDGKNVAIRNLVELGAIELMGKLGKIPYWKCLGVAVDHPEVVREIDDWYDVMSTDEKMMFFKQQFGAIGMFPAANPVDADIFLLAFRVYTQALGFPDNKTISRAVFQAHFAADPKVVGPKALALFEAEKRNRLSLEFKSEPMRLRNELSVSVKASQPSFVYCFLQDEKTRQVHQILPNASHRTNALPAGEAVPLRSLTNQAMTVQLGRPQTLTCLATTQDRSKELPALIKASTGAQMPGVADVTYIKSQLRASGTPLASATLGFGGSTVPANPSERR